MARTGRPKRPTALRVLEGKADKADASSEPQPDPTTPTKPAWLPKEAAAEWDRVAPELERLGLFTSVDGAAFIAYCLQWDVMVKAAADIEVRGVLIPGARGRGELVRNPSVQSMRDAASTMRSFATEYGLTPQSRARMSIAGDDEKDHRVEALFSKTNGGR